MFSSFISDKYFTFNKSRFLEKFPENFLLSFDPFYLLKVFYSPEKSIFPKKFWKNFSQGIDPPVQIPKNPYIKGGCGRGSYRGVPLYPYMVGRVAD